MSDNTSKLSGLAGRLKSSLSKLNDDAKLKAGGKAPHKQPDEHDATDLHQEDELEPMQRSSRNDRLSATDDDITDGLIIDGEAVPQTSKKKVGMSQKQKMLLVAVFIVGAAVYTKMQKTVPLPAEGAKNGAQVIGIEKPANDSGSGIAAPTFELGGSQPHDEKLIPISTSTGHGNGFGSSGTHAQDPANAPIDSDVVTADLNDQFSSMTDDSDQTLDPFSGDVKHAPKQAAALPVSVSPQPQKPVLAAPAKVAATETHSGLGSLSSSEDSPFNVGGSKSTELSGTKNQNADSGKGELLDQGANADVAKLKANIAEKDGRIGTLETEIGKLKTDLATANKELADAKGKGKPVPKATQHKPVPAAHVTQRSTPTHRVASAPKATPRPQICVTAVAQAARNCTTCVPHAFISHKGSETMVGQGDYIEGLRVNIVGDRLDLQNAQGDVVHKFWSSPNGCAG